MSRNARKEESSKLAEAIPQTAITAVTPKAAPLQTQILIKGLK